jgi:hypothetical protein
MQQQPVQQQQQHQQHQQQPVYNGSIRQPGQHSGLQPTGVINAPQQQNQSQHSQGQTQQHERALTLHVPSGSSSSRPANAPVSQSGLLQQSRTQSPAAQGGANAGGYQNNAANNGYGYPQNGGMPAAGQQKTSGHSAEYLQKEAERKAEEAQKKSNYFQALIAGIRLVATKCPDGEGHYYATGVLPKQRPKGDYCVDVSYEAYCPGSAGYPSRGVADNFIGMSGCFGDTYKIDLSRLAR